MALTTIASFHEAYAAHIARAKLEAEGIPVFIADEHVIGVQPLAWVALGGVKVRVPEGYAEQALRVLREDRSAEARSAARQRPPSRHCPRCGSCAAASEAHVRRPRARRPTPFPVEVWSNRRRCEECGARW